MSTDIVEDGDLADLPDQLRGRAQFLADRGEVKTPDALREAADEIERLRTALREAVLEERELCARIAEREPFIEAHDNDFDTGVNLARKLIAHSIRSREEERA